MGKIEKNLKYFEEIDKSLLEETRDYRHFNFIFDNLNKRKKMKRIITILVTIAIICISSAFIYLYFEENKDNALYSKEFLSYNKNNQTALINFIVSDDVISCTSGIDDNNLIFEDVDSNNCTLNVNINDKFLYLKSNQGKIWSFPITDILYDIDTKDTYYIAKDGYSTFSYNTVLVGDPEIKFVFEDDSIASFKNGKLYGKKNGVTKLTISSYDKIYKEINVTVTDTIVEMPKTFNYKKDYLPCKKYTNEEAKLLDTILASRINDAGIQTRAGAVAAARFLTLEFPYRITYFFENGRIDVSGVHFTDGEGRYYHEGLYLSTDKEKSMISSFAGPSMWGCPLTNYEDAGAFVNGKKYPNGLDCSGFVSWVLKNGGFDPGDLGAGNSYSDPRELTDLGEFVRLTNEVINSNVIKVGDLFNDWGHIAILTGMDDNNFYIAESLDIYGGVVLKTYSKKNVMKSFEYVVLMDSYYKKDGNLSNMWY